MFVDTILCVISLAFPDVCKIITPAGPVPVPLLNIVISCTRLPMVINVIMGGGMSLNMFGISPISNGDEAGVAMGVVSQQIVGVGRVAKGSVKVFIGCAPATRMTDITMQNGMVPNAVGLNLSPSQIRVMVVV